MLPCGPLIADDVLEAFDNARAAKIIATTTKTKKEAVMDMVTNMFGLSMPSIIKNELLTPSEFCR